MSSRGPGKRWDLGAYLSFAETGRGTQVVSMGLSTVPPVQHPSSAGLSWLFPLAAQQAGQGRTGSEGMGQPQPSMLRLGWDQHGLWG